MRIREKLRCLTLFCSVLSSCSATFKPLPADQFCENRIILTSLTPLFLGLADRYISEDIWATMHSSSNNKHKGFSKKLLEYTRDTCDGDFLVLLNRVISDQKRYGSFCEFFYEVNEYLKKYCPKINKVFSFTSLHKPKGSLNLMDVLSIPFQSRSDFFQAFLDKIGGASEEYSRFCTTNKCEEAAGVLFSLYQILSYKLGDDPALFHPLLDFVMAHKRQAEAAIPFLIQTLLGVKGQKELPKVIKIPVTNLSDKKDYPQRVFGAKMTYNEFREQTGKGLAEYQGYLDSCLNRGSANVNPDGKVFSISVDEPCDTVTYEECRKQVIDTDLALCSCELTEAQQMALEVLRGIIRQLEESMATDDLSSFLYDTNKSLVDNRCAYVKFLQQPANFSTLLSCVSAIWDDISSDLQPKIQAVQEQDTITEEECRQYDCVWKKFPLQPHEQRLAILMSHWIRDRIHLLDSSDQQPIDKFTLSKYVLYTPLDDGHGYWMSDFVKGIARRDLEHLQTVYADRLRHLPSELDIPFWNRLQAATADQLASALHFFMVQSDQAQGQLSESPSTNGLSQPIQTLIDSPNEVLLRKQIPLTHGAAFFLNNILTVCEPNTVRATLLALIKGVINSTDPDRTLLVGDAQLYQDATDFVRFSWHIREIGKYLDGSKDSDELNLDHVGNFRSNEAKAILGEDSCEKAIDYWRQQRINILVNDHKLHTYPNLFTVFPFYYNSMPEMIQNSPEGEPTQPDS